MGRENKAGTRLQQTWEEPK